MCISLRFSGSFCLVYSVLCPFFFLCSGFILSFCEVLYYMFHMESNGGSQESVVCLYVCV